MTEDATAPGATPAGDPPAGPGDPAGGAPFVEGPPPATTFDGSAIETPAGAPPDLDEALRSDGAETPSAAGASPAAHRPADAVPSRTLLGAVRDNLEAVAFALILALLLRHFCIEVFKIPTASMEPTLFGDGSATHPKSAGDRILVDKLAYLLNDPKRWDVMVFHYPLNWNRNFIKRCVVLPEETFQILSGDIWVAPRAAGAAAMKPARKPRNVRDQLYVPVWPVVDDESEGKRLADWWRPDPGTTGDFRLVSDAEIRFERAASARTGEDATGTMHYGYQVFSATSARNARTTSGNPVRDVRLRVVVEAAAPGEVEISWRPGDGRQHALRLSTPGRAASVLRTKESEYPLAARLAIGGRTTVEFESVDGDVRATVDGREERVVPDEVPLPEAVRQADKGGLEAQDLSITVRGGAVTLRDLRLDHDLYYIGPREQTFAAFPERDKPLTSGADQYFMLGDNTGSSSDSRVWTAYVETLKDGSEVRWDSGNSEDTHYTPHYVDGKTTYSVTDVEGVHRAWREEDIVRTDGQGRRSEPMPFVSRDRIVGRAFFALLFWPLDGATWDRVRFIH